jgi:regulatory protein
MTIVSLKTESKVELLTFNEQLTKSEQPAFSGLNRIELSDGSLFSFRICYLPPELQNTRLYDPSTAEGREITAAEEAAFRHASACLRAEKAALRLIARAEQCTRGIARKLEKRGHESICVSAVISRLSGLRLLDDSRFARLWLESRLRHARSPRRLLSSLCARGIDRNDAEAALKTMLDEEAEFVLLTRFAKKYARKASGRENVTRSLKYLLKSEGFSHAAIRRFFGGE